MALGDDVEVCAEAGDAQLAIRAAMREQPDVCLVGREIPGDAIAAVRGICRAAPSAAVVMLAEFGDADDLLESVRAGAVGYVPGPLDGERLRRIVRVTAVQRGGRSALDGARTPARAAGRRRRRRRADRA